MDPSEIERTYNIRQEGPWAQGCSPENDWSVQWNHLWNFGRLHHEEQFCEIIEFWSVNQEMSFKKFLSGALAVLLFGGTEPFMQFWKWTLWGTFMWSYNEFGPVVLKEMMFKDISYLKLCQPFCSAECNHLCNLGRGYYEKHSVKLFWIWVSGSGGVVV